MPTITALPLSGRLSRQVTDEEFKGAITSFIDEFGVSEETARRMAYLTLGVVATTDADDRDRVMETIVADASKAKEPWAVELTMLVGMAELKPTYEKAIARGVKPVDVIMFETGMSRAEARAVVNHFKKQAAASGGDVEKTDSAAGADPAGEASESGEAGESGPTEQS